MKRFLACALSFSLLFAPMQLFAAGGSGKSYSSGGSSRPSGSSSSSSSSSRPSYSGKSYSSGSTSKPSGSSPSASKPSASSPSGKSYSPGTTSKPSGSSPSASSPSGKSYSPGTTSKPSGSSGGSTSSADGNSRKPSGAGYNNAMSGSAKKEESKTRYEAANAPKPTYKTPGPNGVEKPIKADSPAVTTVRKTVTHERYVTYESRSSVFYGSYYGHPMYYNDFYSPFLMGWILSDAINSHDRAMWMYHHQADMDNARYAELLRRDAKLQAEIDQLKAQKVAIDPSYVPAQMADNPDLMFNKEFVDASYNPVEVEQPDSGTGAGTVLLYIFLAFVIVVIAGLFIFFMFCKEY